MNNEICNLCGNFINTETKEDEFIKPDDFLKLISYREINKLNTKCDVCKSDEFERLIINHLEKNEIFKNIKNPRILHFNPEPLLINYLAQKNPEIHILATKTLQDLRFEGIDIESIPYDGESFDLIIANNLIQKTENFEKALFEINRVLRKNGIAIIQTPYSELLENTFEDSAIQDSELRKKIYGDPDNKRIFGKNIKKQFLQFFESCENDTSTSLFIFKKKNIDQPLKINIKIPLKENSRPLVSILCLTYNHEKYIQTALKGFLNQNTDFSYEIIIADDCSTDTTIHLLKKYQELYVDKIKLISNTKNIGVHQNFLNSISQCSGKYIALCEGDDYWIDNNKLQKQVDFLNNNPQYVLTYSGVQAHQEGKIDYNYVGGIKWDLESDKLKSVQSINTLTVVFKNIISEFPIEINTSGVIDSFIWSLLGNYGRAHYCNNILPSIYRIHKKGIHSSQSNIERKITRIKTYYSLHTYYLRINDLEFSDYFLNETKKDIKYIHENQITLEEFEKLKIIPLEMSNIASEKFKIDYKLLETLIFNI